MFLDFLTLENSLIPSTILWKEFSHWNFAGVKKKHVEKSEICCRLSFGKFVFSTSKQMNQNLKKESWEGCL